MLWGVEKWSHFCGHLWKCVLSGSFESDRKGEQFLIASEYVFVMISARPHVWSWGKLMWTSRALIKVIKNVDLIVLSELFSLITLVVTLTTFKVTAASVSWNWQLISSYLIQFKLYWVLTQCWKHASVAVIDIDYSRVVIEDVMTKTLIFAFLSVWARFF